MNKLQEAGISWVVIGSQTKPTKLPEIEWVEKIVKACDEAGVKVFLKNNLKPLLSQEYNKYPPAWAYSQGLLRQEVPPV